MTPALVSTAACEPIKTATPRYLTAEQVGELLQVSSRTVQRWALAGASVPTLRLGRTVRFPRAELERWFERSTQGSRKSKAITVSRRSHSLEQAQAPDGGSAASSQTGSSAGPHAAGWPGGLRFPGDPLPLPPKNREPECAMEATHRHSIFFRREVGSADSHQIRAIVPPRRFLTRAPTRGTSETIPSEWAESPAGDTRYQSR